MSENTAAPVAPPVSNGALSSNPAPTPPAKPAVSDPNPGGDTGAIDPKTGKPVTEAAPKPAGEAKPLSLETPPEVPPVVDPTKPGTVVTYEPTGDAALDMSLSFLGKHGYGPDHPAMVAAAQGNFAMLKADLATKGIAGAAEHVALGEQAYGNRLAVQNAQVEKEKASILEVVGGEANWSAIKEWAKANAEPAEAIAVNKALSAGGLVAKAVAAHLANLHSRATGTTVEPASVNGGNVASNASAAAVANGPLAPRAYVAAINELKSKIGGANMDTHPEYIKLQQRRRAWKG